MALEPTSVEMLSNFPYSDERWNWSSKSWNETAEQLSAPTRASRMLMNLLLPSLIRVLTYRPII